MFLCHKLANIIKEADANADFVIAVVHWGTEYSYDLEEVQLTTGKEYLDAGADVVIGAHSHCLQGMEYYEGPDKSILEEREVKKYLGQPEDGRFSLLLAHNPFHIHSKKRAHIVHRYSLELRL